MQLNILDGQNRFIVDPQRLDAPLLLPPLTFGDIPHVELRAFRKTQWGVEAFDLSSYEVTLLLGTPNTRPELGFWQLTTSEGTSSAIAARATAQEVQDALASAFGAVTVEGGNGSYIVTLAEAGVWLLPTATFEGNTLSEVLVFQITPGTSETPAQYRIEVLEVAPARIIPSGWESGNTVPASSFSNLDGNLWGLSLDTRTNSGFFLLTVDGETTNFLSAFAGAYEISVALAAIGKPAQVQSDGFGAFYVLFNSAVNTASVTNYLSIFPFLEGSLDLTSTGIRELLDGVQFAPVKLSVLLSKDGELTTVASADLVLQMPINQPATITIDAPQMAGLTFAISEDQSTMHVYQNGVLLYDIPLNTPA
jgi:hypothetical protein